MDFSNKLVVLRNPQNSKKDKNFAKEEKLVGRIAFCISDRKNYIRVRFIKPSGSFDLDKKMFNLVSVEILSTTLLFIAVNVVAFILGRGMYLELNIGFLIGILIGVGPLKIYSMLHQLSLWRDDTAQKKLTKVSIGDKFILAGQVYVFGAASMRVFNSCLRSLNFEGKIQMQNKSDSPVASDFLPLDKVWRAVLASQQEKK